MNAQPQTCIALPCTFISVLFTTLIMTSTSEKNLATTLCVFFVVLTATVTATLYVIYGDPLPDDKPSHNNDDQVKKKKKRRGRNEESDFAKDIRNKRANILDEKRFEHVYSWKDEMERRRRVDEVEKEWKRKVEEERLAEEEKEKKERKKEEKRVRRILIKDFWPKRNTLLGARRREGAEVVEEGEEE